MTDQRDVVRRGYDRLAADYAAARAPDRHDAELLAGLLDRLETGARVLDVGCGDGRPVLSRVLGGSGSRGAAGDRPVSPATGDRRARVLGLDLSREQCRRARERVDGAAAVLQGEMTRLPVADDVVDAVTAFHSVIHVPAGEHPAVYREFARVLRPGGWLLCSAGEQAWEGRNQDWLDTGVTMAWSFPALEGTVAAIEAAGFVVVERLVAEEVLDDETWPFVLARLASA